jgi:hypothetical protein
MTDYFKDPCIALTGGGDGALDAIDGSLLADGYAAYVDYAGRHYVYILDEDSGATEASPHVIAPDSNAGAKRWILTTSGAAAARPGVVRVFPPSNAPSNVLLPDNTWLDVSASTTEGLQEAIDAMAAASGYDLEVIGGCEPITGGAVVYEIQDTLVFPPMQGKSIKFGACTLNCNGNIGVGNGIVFNSCMMVDVDMSGAQIVYDPTNTGSALVFDPTTPVPVDGITAIIASNFKFCAVVNLDTATASSFVVEFNCGTGDILHNKFFFNEINGGLDGMRVQLPGVGSGKVFSDNLVECPDLHGFGLCGLRIGASQDYGWSFSNIFTISFNRDAGQTPTQRLDVWGHDNIFICQFNTDSDAVSNIVWETTAYGNIVITSSLDVAKIVNSAAVKTNQVLCARAKVYASITPGSSPYTYQNVSSFDEVVVVSGGTVSAITYSVDSSNFYATGVTAGSFPVPVGMYLRVTYSSVPTMHRFY